MEYYGQVAEVSGFSDTMESLHIFDLIINQSFYFGSHLSHIWFYPNPIRSHGITVDDTSKHLPAKSPHSIVIKEENWTIPLKLNRVISYCQARTLTIGEIENCVHIILISKEEWHLYSATLKKYLRGRDLWQELWIYGDKQFFGPINHGGPRLLTPFNNISKQEIINTQRRIDPQTGHPIESSFRNKNVMLRCHHLKCCFKSDNFFSNTKSWLQNTCRQLCITDFGYWNFAPMCTKSEVGFAFI